MEEFGANVKTLLQWCNGTAFFSPDSNENPFVPVFGIKDWEWIAGNSS